jgi:cytidyltransferase-like protein
MLKLNKAIIKTICYADIFDYPLSKEEIYRWLIHSRSISQSIFNQALKLNQTILKFREYYHLPNRKKIVNQRLQRLKASQPKLIKVKKISNLLRFIPSINLIAITGALAMNNSDEFDDIDLMIITKSNRLWLTRFLAYGFLDLFSLRRKPNQTNLKDKLCLNLFLDESALVIPASRHNLYTAHEVAQIKPLFDRGDTYQKFLNTNQWVTKFLPHSLKPKSLTTPSSPIKTKPFILETIAFKFQHWYMKPKLTREKVSLHSAFFHPRPTGKIVLAKYHQSLKKFNFPSKKKIKVLVTGVFDILHLEHKKFLQKAKKQGDTLLVGLETDLRVRKLKGPTRPINSIQTRIKNLKKWEIADQVFALPEKFNSLKNHHTLINQIKPNILAVSSQTPNLPTKKKLMKSIGGTLKIVHSHNPKISVTKILQLTK